MSFLIDPVTRIVGESGSSYQHFIPGSRLSHPHVISSECQ